MRALSSRQFLGGREKWRDKRDLILSILKSTTTKREAREYLTRYNTVSTDGSSSITLDADPKVGERIKGMLRQCSPLGSPKDKRMSLAPFYKQVAVFRIPLALLTQALQEMCRSFTTVVKLGVSPILVFDVENPQKTLSFLQERALEVASVMSRAEAHELNFFTPITTPFDDHRNKITILSERLIILPIIQGNIPVLLPVAYDVVNARNSIISPQDALLALVKQLNRSQGVVIEKVVFVDTVGGIPSIERDRTSHVFINNLQEYSDIVSELHIGFLEPEIRDRHLSNLSHMRELLLATQSELKSEATGIILRPEDLTPQADMLNPVAYNILTDRPLISSSLPPGRLRTPQVTTSIIKSGFDVQLFYPTESGQKRFDSLIKNSGIDESKLLLMIDDSFGRRLEREDYLRRLNTCLDCVIIIGNYDGGAIITKEETSDGHKVPYLDKFAITQKNQGLPSLADVIFKLMLQAYPEELIWRSRNTNPVNKWYFERCNGTYHKPGSDWKLFYAGDFFNHRFSRFSGKRISSYWTLIQKIPSSFI